MGAGASAEKMSPEEMHSLAEKALKEMLLISATAACAECSTKAAWQEEAGTAIPVPMKSKFQSAAENVKKIPMLGSKLSAKLEEAIASVDASFVDCAITVCGHEKCLAAFKEVIDTMEIEAEGVDSPVELCKMGGSAFAEFMVSKAGMKIEETMEPVVEEVLKTHSITKLWSSVIDSYNSAASKIPSMTPLEFALDSYLVTQIWCTLEMKVRSKEMQLRANPSECESEVIQQVFGGGQEFKPKTMPKLVLRKKGHPLALVVDSEAVSKAGEDGDGVVLSLATPSGHAINVVDPTPRKSGKRQNLLLRTALCVAPVTTEPPLLLKLLPSEDGFFFIVRQNAGCFRVIDNKLTTDQPDGLSDVFEVKNSRWHEENQVALVRYPNDPESTCTPGLNRSFVVNKEGTISPAYGPRFINESKEPQFVLGLEFDVAAKTVTVGEKEAAGAEAQAEMGVDA